VIIEDNRWILIIFSDLEEFEKKCKKIGGKWLISGPREVLHRYVNPLALRVEKGEFIAVQIVNKTSGIPPFRREDCVICVYTSANEEEKEKTRRRLVRIGLTPYAWKSEEKTSKGWFPGGKWRPGHETVEEKPELEFLDSPSPVDSIIDRSQEEKSKKDKPNQTERAIHKRQASPPVPPFQLDWLEPRLIDANGLPFNIMPPRAHEVLKVMLSREPGGRRIIRGFLSDKTVASLYEGVEIDDPQEAKKTARNFARNLRKTFKKHGLKDPHSLIRISKTRGGYVMGHDWHPRRPLINQAEVTLFFRDHLDDEPDDPD
jgi:hypothetical protein